MFTTPLIRALRRHHPDAHLAYAVEPAAAPVVAGNPHLDRVHVIPRSRGMQRVTDDVKAARELRHQRFDVAIDLHGGPRASWLTWATGAPVRIGYNVPGRTWMYTQTVTRPADDQPRHAVANQWDLLAPLGIAPPSPAVDPVEMPVEEHAAPGVDRVLADAGLQPGSSLVVIHISAGNPFRRWPPEHFATIVTSLAATDPGRRFILTSGPSDRPAAEALVRRIMSGSALPLGTVVHAEFGVAELRDLIARAAVYIGGDSGPLHIAATTETPIVALFGSTLPERSMPWRDPRWFAEAVDAGPLSCRPCRQRQCEPGDFRCLTRISPESVRAAVERAVASATGQTVSDGQEIRVTHSSGASRGWSTAHA